MKIFTSPHSLTNFEIVGCYQNEPKFNGAYLKENLSNFEQIGNSLDHFHTGKSKVVYFDSSGVI